MTLLTNSQNTYAAVGIREDLTDIVSLIDPQETPFMSAIGSAPAAKTTKHEWQTQALAAQDATNFQLEGDDSPSAAAATARVRLYNYCAISRKVGAVTGTDQTVITAGISNELDNQKMLKAAELKRDMEVILLNNQAYDAGSAGTARKCAGVAAYITNTDTAAMGQYTASSGTGATAWVLTNATAYSLSLTSLNAAMQAAHVNGGRPNLLSVSPNQKTKFSNITLQSSLGGAAQVRLNLPSAGPAAIVATADTWVSNFGTVSVASNVQQAAVSFENAAAYLVDTRYLGLSYLRPMFSEDLAKTGDNTKFQILAEYTLQVDAPKSHAILPNLS